MARLIIALSKLQKRAFLQMANHISAKRRIRRNAYRASLNTARTSRMRTFLKKVETAIASGDQKAAAEALKAVQPQLARNSAKGLLHKKTAARKMSRLSARIKALKAAK
jgi:small subunit ribosomal protein S20